MPKGDLAEVSESKIRSYLLSKDHPTGRGKAAFFSALGFRVESIGDLQVELLRIGREGAVASVIRSQFGSKYVVDGYITGPSGASANVRTVWIVAAGTEKPRLVTAYPAP